MGCGCCKGRGHSQVATEESQGVVPTSLAETGTKTDDDDEKNNGRSESKGSGCDGYSSEGSGPPPVKFSETLYNEIRTPADVFSRAPHEVCIIGTSILIEGDDPSYCRALVEQDLEPKRLHVSGEGVPATDPEALKELLGSSGVSICCRKGRKDAPNQDNILFARTKRFTIAGVADGHGIDGHWASHWVAFYTMSLVLSEVVQKDQIPTEHDFIRIFNIVHEAMEFRSVQGPPSDDPTSDEPRRKFDLQSTGSTLSLCIVDKETNIVMSAWVGDSRCVLLTEGTEAPKAPKGLVLPGTVVSRSSVEFCMSDLGSMSVQSLTIDHDPREFKERERIMSNGGVVTNDKRVNGDDDDAAGAGLAMSRALGDLCLHTFGVIHTPGHKVVQLEKVAEQAHAIIVCSDGVWEFVSNSEAGRFIANAGRADVAQATEDLVSMAHQKWVEQDEEEIDDLSAIVVWI